MSERRRILTDPTPLYAAAGAGDLAIATLRSALPALRTQVRELPGRVVAAPLAMTGAAASRATSAYDALAGRGRDVTGRLLEQPSARELQASAATTTRRARAAVTTTRRSVAKVRKATARTTQAAGDTATAAAALVEEGAAQIGDPSAPPAT